jgi:hypothetical protein
VPHIDAELDQALGDLDELEVRLPAIRTQSAHVRRLYDSSRDKVRQCPWPFLVRLESLICGTRL